MIRINCDIGERGPDHPVDRELISWIDIANLACGGHAGDPGSVEAFRRLADARGVLVSAHLSYPDRENFGRRSLDIPVARLLESLEEQYTLLPEVTLVKFHGALYNDSCRRADLARDLASWLRGTACRTVITLPDSPLAEACRAVEMGVMAEAFAERRYRTVPGEDRVVLVSRDKPYASIHDLEEATAHAEGIIRRGEVIALEEGDPDGEYSRRRTGGLLVDTICIHSDSTIALPLAQRLASLTRE